MGENNKPFACTMQGCGMTFTNEDHLTVHKKKHDMSLNFGNGQKTNMFVADQTPTPTRFIRNCEEVGLFQDLQNVNPFEEQFRKAAEAAKSGASTIIHEMEPLVGPQPDDMLHTPHVFPLIETVPSGSGAGPGGGQPRDINIEKEKKIQDSSDVIKPDSNENLPVSLDETQDIIVLNHLKKGPDKVKENVTNNILSPKPANDSLDAQNKDAAVHVLIRMPDGRLVQLSGLSVESPPPSASAVGSISLSPNWQHNNVSVVNNVIQPPIPAPKLASKEPENEKPQGLSFAKLKLKEVLLQNSSANKVAAKKSPTPSPWVGQKTLPIPIERSVPITLSHNKPELLSFKAVDNNVTANSKHKKVGVTNAHKKKRKASPEPEDGKEKRKKFLERNRAAASRCREKRKNWIKSLQRKSTCLETNNLALQAEVASLRAEVTQLRSLLLAHKECPVTLMMQQQPQRRLVHDEQQQPSQQLQNQQKKISTVICRHTPTLSIDHKSAGNQILPTGNAKSSIANGGSASQVLVMSSAQSMASQHGHVLQRQQLLPAIGQTAMGTVLLPSTPESASVGDICDLQAERHATVAERSVDKTLAVVVANPAVVHAVQLSTLNTVPIKLICAPQQLADPVTITDSKEESSVVRTTVVMEKSKHLQKEGDKLSNSV